MRRHVDAPGERDWSKFRPEPEPTTEPDFCSLAREATENRALMDLHIEQAVLAEPCPKCGYHFLIMPETRDSTAVFKDVPELAAPL
jgi:hypothetical protein